VLRIVDRGGYGGGVRGAAIAFEIEPPAKST